MNSRRTTTQSRKINAPIDTVSSLLSDTRSWSRWGPLSDAGFAADLKPKAMRFGRHRLRIKVVSPDAPFWTRVQVHTPGGWFSHIADVTLSPLDDGSTGLSWHATLTGPLPDLIGRRRAYLQRAVSELTGQLASYAEDPPTTRRGHVGAMTVTAPPSTVETTMAA
jgi:hypothetical protein